MILRAACREDLRAMMTWFPDADSCRNWGGPEFRFPFTEQSFVEDARFPLLPSYVGTDGNSVLGFGQYYLRAGRCHVSRLAVAPAQRGQGLGAGLLAALVDMGARALGVRQCSLFVSAGNERAARLYRRLGFAETDYPDAQAALAGSLYLVAQVERVLRRESRPA